MSEIERLDKMLPGETTLEYHVRVARAEERERCIAACREVEQRIESGSADNRQQHRTGAVLGASMCIDRIRALSDEPEGR